MRSSLSHASVLFPEGETEAYKSFTRIQAQLRGIPGQCLASFPGVSHDNSVTNRQLG